MVKVFCKNTGTFKEFQEGTTLLDALKEFDLGETDSQSNPVLAAIVNNVVQGLRFKLYNNKDVEFVNYRSYSGRGVYTRSLCFIFTRAANDVFPGSRIFLRRPISKGYFCAVVKPDGSDVSQEGLERIKARMNELIAADLPLYRLEVQASEAIKTFSRAGRTDVVRLIETTQPVYVNYYKMGNTCDYYYNTLVPSTSYIKLWDLRKYRNGLLLMVPDRHHPDQLAPFFEQPKTFDVFAENIRWNAIMKLDNVGDVNVACQKGRASELIQVAEALQEKKIVQIAEEIDRRFHSDSKVRLVLITGPTSSGKTTFCKRLSVQLKCCGLHPISFSTDDYFVNRLDTPKLPDGNYDFDNFDTVDHVALQKDMLKLLDGETVQVPEYNFVTGIREYNGKTLKLEEDTVLLVEGIHALNPRLTDQVPASVKFSIFINTITSISLDDHNCIPTSDNRLLRRIVRDYNKGAFGPRETISNWPNVRRAEVKWIYPFQEYADVLFNSAYLVEFAVLRPHAEQILRTIPKNCPEYCEAHRLLGFLEYFNPVSDKDVPATSLLRGFIGGSSF